MKNRPLESAFQKKVLKKLKTLPNCWVFKASDRLKSGIPDILMCFKGHFKALELKRDSKSKASKLQEHTLDQIRKADGEAWVVSPETWDDIWDYLQRFAGAIE